MTNHWPTFVQFVKDEVGTGGPDPQIALIAELAKEYSAPERVWLAGCYCTCHCVPTAYTTWKTFPMWYLEESSRSSELNGWLVQNWAGLPVRPEMRSHRMVEKRQRCIEDFAAYARLANWNDPRSGTELYEFLWNDSQARVKYFGRYMAIKYLELLRVLVRPDLRMPDMRARGAWSPRRTLSWLWPEYPQVGDKDDNTKTTLDEVDHLAEATLDRLAVRGVKLNYFQLQVLLCEYREALAGGFYPGGSHDEELGFIRRVGAHFGPDAVQPIYDARARIFPRELLGEHNDWTDLRKDKFQAYKEVR